MEKIRLFLIICFVCVVFASCAKKDVFKDPAVSQTKSLYRVNKEVVNLPLFFDIPSVNPSVKLNFEKIRSQPIEIILKSTIEGWKAPNGKILSSGAESFGIILDFSSGKVYEMPKHELERVSNSLKPEDKVIIAAVYPSKSGGKFTKMVVIDAKGDFDKQELQGFNMIGNFSSVHKEPEIQPEVTPVTGAETNSPIINNGKDFVIAGRPVISAAAGGQYDRLLRLLNSGENIDETDSKTGDNALIKSIKNGHTDIADLLINNGININHTNLAGQTALHTATDNGFYDLSKQLINKGASVNAKDKSGNTPLLYGAASSNPFIVDLLIENGAKTEDKNKLGETPLQVAALAGNTKTVENLIKTGADFKSKDNDGNGVLMKAVAGNNRQTFNKIIETGLSPDEPNNFGVRPLHVAVKAGYDDMVKNLLKQGADVNSKDPQGNTPLMLAVDNGDTKVVNDILAYQPDIMVKNNEGETAYDIAFKKGYGGIKRTLENMVKDGDTLTELLFNRAAVNDLQGVETALSKGARINGTDTATGNNVLFTAAANNFRQLSAKLIEKGADVNHLNIKGNTPLIVAVISADKPMVDLLIKSGAFVNARNNTGDTALIWAVKLKKIDMVKSLLLAGSDPNIKNSDGVTAHMIAENEGSPEILKLLKAAGGYK